MLGFKTFASIEEARRYVENKRDFDKVIIVYDKKGKYLCQGKVVFMNKSFFILQDNYNLKDSAQFVDLLTGEKKVG